MSLLQTEYEVHCTDVASFVEEGTIGTFLKCCPLPFPEWCQDLISFQNHHGEEILKVPQQLRQNNFAMLLLDE